MIIAVSCGRVRDKHVASGCYYCLHMKFVIILFFVLPAVRGAFEIKTLLRDALKPGVSPVQGISEQRVHRTPQGSFNKSSLPPGCNPRTGKRCRDPTTGLLPLALQEALEGKASVRKRNGTTPTIVKKRPSLGKTSLPPPPPPVPDTACADVLDPTSAPPRKNTSSTTFRPAAAQQQQGHAQGYMVFHGGGNALGNLLLGYLTSFHDALRSSRRLLLHSSGMGLMQDAFELGVEFATEQTMKIKPPCQIFFDYAVYPPASKDDVAVCQTYLENGIKGPRVPSCLLAHSRPKNFHFDRSKLYRKCYHKALGCPTPLADINTAKQEANPVNYCGESFALRRLLTEPSAELKRLSAQHFRKLWNGDPERLVALVRRSGSRGNLTGPIWSVAIHARVQFPFVEAGLDERDAKSVEQVEEWLRDRGTKRKLQALVRAAKGGAGARGSGGVGHGVYVASETALVRRHVADLLRAEGVSADYFMHSGRAHPVNTKKGSAHFGARFLPLAQAKDDEERADLLFPYLEWWALAHSRVILVKRHMDLRTSPSTYSGSAHLYGGWYEGGGGGGGRPKPKGGSIATLARLSIRRILTAE
jgi:hypothetical protein